MGTIGSVELQMSGSYSRSKPRHVNGAETCCMKDGPAPTMAIVRRDGLTMAYAPRNMVNNPSQDGLFAPVLLPFGASPSVGRASTRTGCPCPIEGVELGRGASKPILPNANALGLRI